MMLRMNYLTRYAHGAEAHYYTYLLFSVGDITDQIVEYSDVLLEKYSLFKPYIPRIQGLPYIRRDPFYKTVARYNYQYYEIVSIGISTQLYVYVWQPYIKYITLSLIQYMLSTSTFVDIGLFIDLMVSADYRTHCGRRYKYIYTQIFKAIVTHHLHNTTFHYDEDYEPARPLYVKWICIKYPGHYRTKDASKNVTTSDYVTCNDFMVLNGVKLPVDWASSTEYD